MGRAPCHCTVNCLKIGLLLTPLIEFITSNLGAGARRRRPSQPDNTSGMSAPAAKNLMSASPLQLCLWVGNFLIFEGN